MKNLQKNLENQQENLQKLNSVDAMITKKPVDIERQRFFLAGVPGTGDCGLFRSIAPWGVPDMMRC